MIRTTENYGRQPFRRRSLLEFIRQKVHSGAWAPGERLPGRVWFEQEFEASPHTVQDAFSILLEDGVLITEGRRGTRVSLTPPHLTRYGLVLYNPENFFIRSLLLAAEELRRTEGRDIVSYVDLDLLVSSDDHRRLMRDLEHQTLAGLFFASAPKWLEGTPILTAPGVPRTMMAPAPEPPGAHCDIVPIPLEDSSCAPDAVLRTLVTAGVRRIAILLGGNGPEEERAAHLLETVARHGIECRPELLHFCNPNSPSYVESITRLIFSDLNRLRPDAIYIEDDNFLPHAIRGIVESLGEIEARKIKVFSRVNVPMAEPVDFPVRYFNLDTVQLLRRVFAEIDRLRRESRAQGRL